MPIYTDKVPQAVTPIKTTTLKDVIRVLPETLQYPLNVWLGDKIARFGITTGNLMFLVEQDGETSSELKQYFSGLVKPLGIQATTSSAWKNNKFTALRLYNEGRLIIDKSTFSYRELPSQTHTAPVITVDDLKAKLPQTIQWQYTLYLTGGLEANGWSANDVRIIIFDAVRNKQDYADIRNYFTNLLGWKTHVVSKVVPERVRLYKLYENGVLRLK